MYCLYARPGIGVGLPQIGWSGKVSRRYTISKVVWITGERKDLMKKSEDLLEIYDKLKGEFGFLNWWPGETKDEILIGAILTQQTSWKNVEKSIKSLKDQGLLSVNKISKMNPCDLAPIIRSSGFYKQKAIRLVNISNFIISNYRSLSKFLSLDKSELRGKLLSLNGVGKETADSIILYCSGKPIFVVDAYTRRELSRIISLDPELEYDELRGIIEGSIPQDIELYKDFHAQIVELGKTYCKKVPLCGGCPLNRECLYGKQSA